jgi:hypothetical protein
MHLNVNAEMTIHGNNSKKDLQELPLVVCLELSATIQFDYFVDC